ncbi:MAG: hypothetical protein AAF682_15080 [Planctomycetota bacterium]
MTKPTLLGAACAAANAIVNAQQQATIDQLWGHVFMIECRDLLETRRGKELASGEGQDVDLSLEFVGVSPLFAHGSGIGAWLVPAEEEWTLFRRLAQREATCRMLDWSCAAELCRPGRVDLASSAASFVGVPEGTYDLFVRWTANQSSSHLRHAVVQALAGAPPASSTLGDVPEDRQGEPLDSYTIQREARSIR